MQSTCLRFIWYVDKIDQVPFYLQITPIMVYGTYLAMDYPIKGLDLRTVSKRGQISDCPILQREKIVLSLQRGRF
jgi:hypothetical protein